MMCKIHEKVDEITNDNVILVVNFFSKSWLPIFKVFSKISLIKNYEDHFFFRKYF